MKYDDWLERETSLIIDEHCKDGRLIKREQRTITATIGIEDYAIYNPRHKSRRERDTSKS